MSLLAVCCFNMCRPARCREAAMALLEAVLKTQPFSPSAFLSLSRLQQIHDAGAQVST